MHSNPLQQLFKPTSIAVLGASNEPGTPGYVAMRNLTRSNFLGPVMPIHPEQLPIHDLESYKSVDTLPLTPDLALICEPLEQAPALIEELGKRGTSAVVLLSRGGFRESQERRAQVNKTLLDAARPYGVRILGPNCLGFINPVVGVNASLAHRNALPGKLAFISQSDALFASVLDWASSKHIGFSYFISLGDRCDLNLGHLLDFLNRDPNTRAVLMYIESVNQARNFLSAARALSRNKPILVIKAGRSEEGARAAAMHSSAFLGADDVYDAAFRRAGMLRVFDIDGLFDTVETLARTRPISGDRLAILTNGGSPGFLAADELILRRGSLAELSPETRKTFAETLGNHWSYWNPLVISSHSSGEVYETALKLLAKDKNVDAVLTMHIPTATVTSEEVAESIIRAAKKTKKNVFTSWLGIENAEPARQMFDKAGICTYFTPEKAVRAFLNMVEYRRNQDLLMETPASMPKDFDPDTFSAKRIVSKALEQQRQVLTEPEAKDVLSAYDIPTVPSALSSDLEGIEGAVEAAAELGFPVALKVISPEIKRKSLAGGVALDLENEDQVREAARAILLRVRLLRPDARVLGFTVQRMVHRAHAHELHIEVATDPVFGPIIRFGQGGSLQEVAADMQAALPPLNMSLAKELVSRTKAFSYLQGYEGHPQVDLQSIYLTLIKISQLTIDIPDIFEIEINPLYVDDKGVLALDAQIRIARAELSGPEQLAIRPYPGELFECGQLKDGRHVTLRPIRPEDEPAHYEFLEHVSAEDKRLRFFGNVGMLPRQEMHKLCQIDYDREMAIIATGPADGTEDVTLGVVRAITDPENLVAEFAILLRSDIKRKGLGRMLMEKIIRYCRSRGTKRIVGQALMENKGMVALARAVGFDVKKNYDDEVWEFVILLNP